MNVRRALCPIIIALVLLAPFAPVRADVVLKGDRRDPCQEMRKWQSYVAKNPSDLTNLRLVQYSAEACSETYPVFLSPERCDAELIAAYAADAGRNLEDDRARKIQFAEAALVDYEGAKMDCQRPKQDLDSISRAEDRLMVFVVTLLKNP